MGKIMEAIFCIIYLILTSVLGITIVARSKGDKEHKLFGIMSLILVFGDSFHLVPRIISAFDKTSDLSFALGMGKLVTSVTMTIFYLLMFMVFSIRYKFKNQVMLIVMCLLTLVRIGLCMFPQNNWVEGSDCLWGIYRNIPFLIMGIIMVVLYFMKRKDAPYKFMWLAITLSFLFYIPVVLWSDVHKMIGMLMMPKTCMYVWIVMMGLLEQKKSAR